MQVIYDELYWSFAFRIEKIKAEYMCKEPLMFSGP